jgi:hypothetical protein
MGDPQVTMGFNTKTVVHDLDDLGVPFRSASPRVEFVLESRVKRLTLRALLLDTERRSVAVHRTVIVAEDVAECTLRFFLVAMWRLHRHEMHEWQN